MTHRPASTWLWGATVIAVVAAGAVVATLLRATPTQASSARDHAPVELTISSCGGAWGTDSGAQAPGGEHDFTFENGNTGDVEVQLQEQSTKKVYLEIDGIGPGATGVGSVVLDRGRYRFVCFPADADPVIGPTVTVSAAPRGARLTPGVVPLTTNDLIPVAKAYGARVAARLPELHAQVAQLATDAARGDLAAAKTDWLTAHLDYETLGAAYDAFGDYDAKINGTPASGKTALGDTGLTGFHRVEALLWSGAPAAQVEASAHRLLADVTALAASHLTDRIDPLQVGLRAHEIVENAIQFELTGETDAGSHSNLATIDANLAGATQALSFLKPLMASRYAGLGSAEAALAASRKLVESYRSGGSWAPLTSLGRAQRQRLNASLDSAAELLAPVAEIAEPRKAVS
jgi:iron uptake system component EfeO